MHVKKQRPCHIETINNLRNIFDQYKVPENRISNALLQLLAADKNALRKFLNDFLKIELKEGSVVTISTQKVPGGVGDSEKEQDEAIVYLMD